MQTDGDQRYQVAARAAHEINNALAGIQYSFLLIKDAIPAGHPQYSSAAAIERGVARITAVTRELAEAYPRQQDGPLNSSRAKKEL